MWNLREGSLRAIMDSEERIWNIHFVGRNWVFLIRLHCCLSHFQNIKDHLTGPDKCILYFIPLTLISTFYNMQPSPWYPLCPSVWSNDLNWLLGINEPFTSAQFVTAGSTPNKAHHLIELETKVAEIPAKFYNHREGPYLAFTFKTLC